MKDSFEIPSQSTGPTTHGSLHAAASLQLGQPAEPAPSEVAPTMMTVRATVVPTSPGPSIDLSEPSTALAKVPPIEPVISSRTLPPPSRPLTPRPTVSFIISTFNRKDVVLQTLAQIDNCGLSREEYETLVVDNASTDGTGQALRQAFPLIHLLERDYNQGPVSKNLAIRSARGRYVVFLDDDSFPQPGSVHRMIRHFEADPKLGAACFNVILPDGARECSAYPNVFIGCGTGFRRTVLEQAGGLPEDFFMQAEEYDLSLRILAAGYEIKYFDDIYVTHLKSPTARSSERTTQFDVRNNLVLITRYFPKKWVLPFVKDWLRRYRMIAASKGHELAYFKGMMSGLFRTMRPSNRRPVDEHTFEKLVKLNETEIRLHRAVKEHGLKKILFVDFGKNMLPFYLAAQKLGLEIVAIADERLGAHGRRYRKIPIFNDEMCRRFTFDAAVVSNLSPVHAAQRRDAWRQADTRLVIDLFEDDRYSTLTFSGRASQGFPQTVAQSA